MNHEKILLFFCHIGRNFLGKSGNICKRAWENGLVLYGYCGDTCGRDGGGHFLGPSSYKRELLKIKLKDIWVFIGSGLLSIHML